jgi:hypothetical protein
VALQLPIGLLKMKTMNVSFKNRFHLNGEVVGVIDSRLEYKLKIMCKPGVMIIEADDIDLFKLGDQLKITGTFIIDNIDFNSKKTINNEQLKS